MAIRIQFVVRTAWRRRTLLLPALVVQTVTMAMICALTAIVTALLNGDQPTGPLTIFLGVTVLGLLTVSLSMFGVVRAGLRETLTTLELMGSTALDNRLVMAGVALLTGGLGALAGAVAAFPAHYLLTVLLRGSGYHGMPTHQPSWHTAFALAVTCTLLLAAAAGFTARDVLTRRSPRRSDGARKARLVLALVFAALAGAALSTTSLAGFAAGSALGLVAAILLASPLLLGLAWMVGRVPLRSKLWPMGFAGRTQHDRRTTRSVTVGALAVCLVTGITGAVSSYEQLSRAAVADRLRGDAFVVTRDDGNLLSRDEAETACHDAGPACAGVLWISGPSLWPVRDAVTTPTVVRALLKDPSTSVRHTLVSGFAGPWPAIVTGATPRDDRRGLPVLTSQGTAGTRMSWPAMTVMPAQRWAQTAPSQVVILGSGAADIVPMLLPLLLLAALFCAASSYTTHAAQGRKLTTLHRSGARPAAAIAWCATEAATTTAAIFVPGATLWWAITSSASRLASHRGLTGYLDPQHITALPAAAVGMVVLLTVLASTASRESLRLAL